MREALGSIPSVSIEIICGTSMRFESDIHCELLKQHLRYSLAGQDTQLSPEQPGFESRWRNIFIQKGNECGSVADSLCCQTTLDLPNPLRPLDPLDYLDPLDSLDAPALLAPLRTLLAFWGPLGLLGLSVDPLGAPTLPCTLWGRWTL
eukprot:10342913-Karenia_brevis.AAC.1